MGRRLLRSWVGKPLRQREAIEARLDAVQEVVEEGEGGQACFVGVRTATLCKHSG